MLDLVSIGIYHYLQELNIDLQEIPVKSYKKGEVISSSDAQYCVGYILRGEVKMVTTSQGGKHILVDELSREGFCGHFSKAIGQNLKCDIIAKTDCSIMEIHEDIFNRLIKNREFAKYFYLKTTDRIYYMYKMMLMKYLFELDEIVAYYVWINTKNNYFVCKSIYQLCECLHISRRGLYNSLNKLIEEGILEKSSEKYIVRNLEQLKVRGQEVYEFFERDAEEENPQVIQERFYQNEK